ncbi:ATP-grasp domain-containing protein [Actinocorallia sp. API 0066]|uniref:ATP-grasp domain-containing protein n=1 Tax=Actinocorallia sp. API 0066 TaxID=2896846 RepID=UPI001E5F2B0B|nr:ATP-grasp domain-containing protein [Actinocorallia sp. API 0066]MCD0453395.1 ATP-grasp domain-containing protein [Actinocorallia sp. API 0066]
MTTAKDRPLLLIVITGQREYREYLLRSIATEYRIHLVTPVEPTWEKPYLDGATVVPDTGADQVVAAAKALAATADVAGVLSWHEEHIVQAALAAEALNLPGTPADAVRRCRDKSATRTTLAAHHLPQPNFALVGALAEARAAAARIGYPVVIKPRAAGGSQGVVLVADERELTDHFAATRDVPVTDQPIFDRGVLVEEFLDGPEISIDSAVHNGTVTPVFLARKQIGYPPFFEETGHLVTADDPLLHDERLRATLTAVHRALGYTQGWTHCELKLTATGPKLIEVNARLGGDLIPYLGLLATGVDPGLITAALACGIPPMPVPTHSQTAGIRFHYPPHPDSVVTSITFPTPLPEGIEQAIPLIPPNTRISPPVKGNIDSRLALVTATAPTPDRCQTLLTSTVPTVVLKTP